MTRSDARDPDVSVIVPARNAEATLPAALRSILGQTYAGDVEVIVADGSQSPATRDLLAAHFPRVRRIANPDGGISAGLNRALAAARHRVIVRCDARVALPPGYVARAVATLRRTGASCVGGRQHGVGCSVFEHAVAVVTRHALGTGGARFRVGGRPGPVDTVFLGVFPRDVLRRVGGWDETLARNEDYELNWRLRARGGTVWFDPELVVSYRPRGSFSALARQYFDYGWWKAVVVTRHPRSCALRHWRHPCWSQPSSRRRSHSAPRLSCRGRPPRRCWQPPASPCPASTPSRYSERPQPFGCAAPGPERCSLRAVAATIHLAWGMGFLRSLPRALLAACGRARSDAP